MELWETPKTIFMNNALKEKARPQNFSKYNKNYISVVPNQIFGNGRYLKTKIIIIKKFISTKFLEIKAKPCFIRFFDKLLYQNVDSEKSFTDF